MFTGSPSIPPVTGHGNTEARTETPEHICGQCRTPLGKSSIKCKNEPKEER